ncbi:MAG: response regulator [Nannocystales bacterium]
MGARVLVVDDDPWILRMVTATLQKRDYVVDTAREGRQALQRASANPPDVIISDVMMPVMDGWTFVEQLRRDPRLSTIPVIFLTALGKDEARIAELGLSPDDFLAKPFRFDALEKRVAAALAKPAAAPVQPHPQAAMPAHPNANPNANPHANPNANVDPYAPPPGSTPVPGTYGGQPAPAARPAYTSPGAYGAAAAPAPSPGYAAPQAPVAPAAPEEPPVGGFAPDFPARQVEAVPPHQEPLRAPPKTAEVRAAAAGTEPRRTRRTTALNGRLEQLQLSSLLVMMEMERKDGLLALKDSRTGVVGRIFLRRGQVICAKLGDNDTGKECVYDMLGWKAGTFSFNAMEVEMEDTINSSTTHLLMEGARLIDEANREEGF